MCEGVYGLESVCVFICKTITYTRPLFVQVCCISQGRGSRQPSQSHSNPLTVVGQQLYTCTCTDVFMLSLSHTRTHTHTCT